MRSVSFISAVVACLIFGGLGALTVADMFDGPGTARQEREAATPPPVTDLGQLPRFLANARFYVGERYALKGQFVSWNGAAKRAVFGHSSVPRVSFGAQETLFLINDDTVRLSQGRDRMSAEEQAKWQTHFESTQTRLADLGIGYAFVLGPNKHSVYPERLPGWLDPVDPSDTRTQDVIDAARGAFGPAYPDNRRLLIDARVKYDGRDIYHPTDTHWTELGAALAVQAALSELGIDVDLPEFAIEELSRSGDMARMIGQQRYWDARAPVVQAGWSCVDPDGAPLEVITIDPLLPRRFTCGTADGRPEKLVVFHDSFGVSAIPFLASHFETVEFIWSDAVDPQAAASLGATHVVHIQVERKMTTTTPDDMLADREGGQ